MRNLQNKSNQPLPKWINISDSPIIIAHCLDQIYIDIIRHAIVLQFPKIKNAAACFSHASFGVIWLFWDAYLKNR